MNALPGEGEKLFALLTGLDQVRDVLWPPAAPGDRWEPDAIDAIAEVLNAVFGPKAGGD